MTDDYFPIDASGCWSDWSDPYMGVQHREFRRFGKAIYQASVDDRGDFAEAILLDLESCHAFTPVREGTFPTAAEARDWIDKTVLRES